MTKVIGSDVIVKDYPEGIYSGEGGGQHLTRPYTVVDNTAIDEFELVMTIKDTGAATYGEILPYTGPASAVIDNYGTTTVAATHTLVGISAGEIVGTTTTDGILPVFVHGGYKYDKIKDAATLIVPEIDDLLKAKGIVVTEPLRGNGD